jgi:hypothetical protein
VTIRVRNTSNQGWVAEVNKAMIKAGVQRSILKIGNLYKFGSGIESISILERSLSREFSVNWSLSTLTRKSSGYRFFSSIEKGIPTGNLTLEYDAAKNLYRLLRAASYQEVSKNDGEKTVTTLGNSDGSMACTETLILNNRVSDFRCELKFSMAKE